MIIIYDYSRKNFDIFLKAKCQVKRAFLIFITFIENQTGDRVQKVRTDNGREYVNKELTDFFNKAGIQHQNTGTKSTPEWAR